MILSFSPQVPSGNKFLESHLTSSNQDLCRSTRGDIKTLACEVVHATSKMAVQEGKDYRFYYENDVFRSSCCRIVSKLIQSSFMGKRNLPRRF